MDLTGLVSRRSGLDGSPDSHAALALCRCFNGCQPVGHMRGILVASKSGLGAQADDSRTWNWVDALEAATHRLRQAGPNADDVASTLALAQLFPGVFGAVYDRQGRYRWVSDSFASLIGASGPGMIGRTLDEFFDSSWCEERLAIFRNATDQGLPIVTVEIFRGRRMESAVIPIQTDTDDPMVMYIGRFGVGGYTPADNHAIGTVSIVLLEIADWGPLSVLTRRELEVLRFIALGLDNQSIARRIHRTKRAVEWHIQNLYHHLGSESRSDLLRRGLFAGLPDIHDAQWERIVTHAHARTGTTTYSPQHSERRLRPLG